MDLAIQTYIPRIDKIKNVSISYNGMPDLILQESFRPASFYTHNNNGMLTTDNKNDILKIRSIHQSIINQGFTNSYQESNSIADMSINNEIGIVYTLKNGKQIRRHYRQITITVLEDMLCLDDTQAFKEYFYNYIEGNVDKTINKDDKTLALSKLDPDEAYIYISQPLSENGTIISEINKDISQEIRQALKKDFENLSYQDRYFPQEKELYIIGFVDKDHIYPDIIVENSIINIWRHMSSYSIKFMIDASYENTIDIIQKYYEKEEYTIEHILVAGRYSDMLLYNYNKGNTIYQMSPFFISTNIVEHLDDATVDVTEPKQMDELYEASRGIYHMSDDGYIIYVTVTGNEHPIARYVPKDLMPQYIVDLMQ